MSNNTSTEFPSVEEMTEEQLGEYIAFLESEVEFWKGEYERVVKNKQKLEKDYEDLRTKKSLTDKTARYNLYADIEPFNLVAAREGAPIRDNANPVLAVMPGDVGPQVPAGWGPAPRDNPAQALDNQQRGARPDEVQLRPQVFGDLFR